MVLMRHFNSLPWLLLGVLLLAALMLQLVGAGEAAENASTESNEIIPREAIQKLDFSVRQALLRAIDKLEQEEAAAKASTDSGEGRAAGDHVESTTLATTSPREKEEILEESTNEAETEPVVPTVQFYTATFDERNAQEQLLSSFIDRSKVWKKTTTLRKQQLEETGPENRQLTRSVDASSKTGGSSGSLSSNEISHDGSQEIKFEIRSNAKKEATTSTTTSTTTTTTPRPRTTRRRPPTTTTTTTTTTPRPTHNEDGENIELVDKQDIRIQEAPLVTAFTVDLDERGTAQKFRPLLPGAPRPAYHIGPTITKLSVLESEPPATPLPTQNPATSSTTQITTSTSNSFSTTPALLASSSTTSNYVKEPLTSLDAPPSVNNYLIERHRALEQQIYQLKLQAQQQQALILRQLKLLEEQTQSRFSQAAPIAQSSTLQVQQQQQLPQAQQQQQQQQLQHGSLEAIQTLQPPSPGYSIRPSVEFIPSTHTKTIIYPTYPIEQQLPLRDAVAGHKFALHSTNSNSHNNNNINNYQKLQTPTNAVQQIFQNLQQNLQKANENAANNNNINNNVHIQPSNQFNFAPGEASLLQALPQHNYQQFQPQQQQQLPLPNYVSNALYQQQQQQRARHFRQETGVGNFGLNSNVEIQPSNSFATTIVSQQQQQQQQQQQPSSNLENQNFYRQHLTPQLSSRLQQNAQQYLQQQLQLQQQQQPNGPNGANEVAATPGINSGNPHYKHRHTSPSDNQLSQFSNLRNLEELKVISKVLALNHGIPQFTPQKLHFQGAF